MAIDEQGREGERLFMDLLWQKKTLCKFQPDCIYSWRDGEWIVAEVKNQHYYEAPPFDGHGLPPYQVASRLKFYKETGVRCLFFVHEPNTQTAYWQWLDVLDKGQQFITKGKKQRVVYPLASFHKIEIPESILEDRK